MGGKPKARPKLRRALARASPLSRQSSAASSAHSAASSAPGPMSLPAPRVPRAAPPPRGGMLFAQQDDRALADRQRASIRFIAARLGGQLLAGNVSLRSTAMPVHLNEPRSFLQRLADDLPYATVLLAEAAAAVVGNAGTGHREGCRLPVDGGGDGESDGDLVMSAMSSSSSTSALASASASELASLAVLPILSRGLAGVSSGLGGAVVGPAYRLAMVAAFVVSGIHNSATLAKAFNPHIGETYAATFGPADAPIRIYFEQTRHHPPVSHFSATAPASAWSLAGYSSFDSNFRIHESALQTRRTGIVAVDFGGDEHDRVVYTLPVMIMRGILGGERRVDVQGPCSLYYERYGLVMDLLFDPLQSSGNPSAAGGVVSAAASLIPTFGLFGAPAPGAKGSSAPELETRDIISDAVRGVLYQVDPLCGTGFTRAYAASSGADCAATFFGDPDKVAQGLASSSADGDERPSAETHISEAIELRADKDVTESVTTAWAAGLAEEDVEPGHGEDASPGKLSRRIIALASGSWLSHFDVAGERLWDLSVPRYDPVPVPLDQSLPSDSRFRPDIVSLEEALGVENGENGGDTRERDALLDVAQQRKEELEDAMRAENRLRPWKENVNDAFFPKSHLGVSPK